MNAADSTLGDIVASNARRFPDQVAYRDIDREVSHAGLHHGAVKLASAMAAAGLRRQDRIALIARNSVRFGEVLAACQLSGIIAATPNWRWSSTELAEAVRRVSPRMVFCDEDYLPLVTDVTASMQEPCQAVSLGAGAAEGYDDLIASGSETLPFASRPDDIAYLLFTSGTTGASKCCIIGHREFHGVSRTMNVAMRAGSRDRVLINMPICHIGGLAIAAGVHAEGGSVVLQRQFDAQDTVRLTESDRITVLHFAPVMLQHVLDAAPGGRGLESVRTVVCSAAPITLQLLRRARSALPNAGFANLYGQTEGIVSGLPPELHTVETADALGSVGFPFVGASVRIVDDDGSEVVPGRAGEIAVRADTLFRGYWNDHAATLAVLRDGWYHTGDVGRIDERGLLFLVDRKKDVIITGGENVYSPEVEEAVGAHETVAECAVVGVADERWGEAVAAVVVLQAGSSVTLAELQDVAAKTLARFKLPKRLVIVAELPRLSSGKVDKKRLRADLATSGRSVARRRGAGPHR